MISDNDIKYRIANFIRNSLFVLDQALLKATTVMVFWENDGTMRIVICDDEKRICSILKEKVKEICPYAEVITYTSGEELLLDDIFPDLLLLDIKMPGMNGMDTAKELREKGWRKILIFVTGEEDRVFDSFDLHAFHFLVKPITDEKLKEVLKSAVSELEHMGKPPADNDRYIDIRSGTSHIRLKLRKLLYAEVFNRKTILHTREGNIEYYGQLSALEKLAGSDFYRIHRSYLVNMKYIERYDKAFVTLTGGDSIPIARREYDGFLRAYMEYVQRKVPSCEA